MYFQLLGPLRVRNDDRDVHIPGTRRRALLSILVAHAGIGVGTAQIIDYLWEDSPPSAARATLQSHVSALRRLIGQDRIRLQAGTYVLHAERHEIDARIFESEVDEARTELATGNPAAAAVTFERALGRWRGPAIADALGAHWAMADTARLEEVRGGAIEGLLEALLQLGEHHRVAALAEDALPRYRWRERLWAHLMLALYRSGRQSEALRAYQRLRRELSDELGISPSPDLVRLEEAIILQKPELDDAPGEHQPLPGTLAALYIPPPEPGPQQVTLCPHQHPPGPSLPL